MSLYEYISLSYEATALIDSTFDTWMAATFAIVIAAHIAGEKLNLNIKIFIAILYTASAFIFFWRYADLSRQVAFYFSQISDQELLKMDPEVIRSIGLMRRLVMAVGSVGAVILLFVPRFYSQRQQRIPEVLEGD